MQECFEGKYVRQPTHLDTLCQMNINEAQGWHGMFVSIDCMHWRWKICPSFWAGQ